MEGGDGRAATLFDCAAGALKRVEFGSATITSPDAAFGDGPGRSATQATQPAQISVNDRFEFYGRKTEKHLEKVVADAVLVSVLADFVDGYISVCFYDFFADK